MKTFKIDYVSTKKYEPKIIRHTMIQTKDIFNCKLLFEKNFKECDTVKIVMVQDGEDVVLYDVNEKSE